MYQGKLFFWPGRRRPSVGPRLTIIWSAVFLGALANLILIADAKNAIPPLPADTQLAVDLRSPADLPALLALLAPRHPAAANFRLTDVAAGLEPEELWDLAGIQRLIVVDSGRETPKLMVLWQANGALPQRTLALFLLRRLLPGEHSSLLPDRTLVKIHRADLSPIRSENNRVTTSGMEYWSLPTGALIFGQNSGWFFLSTDQELPDRPPTIDLIKTEQKPGGSLVYRPQLSLPCENSPVWPNFVSRHPKFLAYYKQKGVFYSLFKLSLSPLPPLCK